MVIFTSTTAVVARAVYVLVICCSMLSSLVKGFGLRRAFVNRRLTSRLTLSMKLNCGIVGLPNVGKSTLFNALVGSEAAQAANFPFCTIEPNVGLVYVPDPKLDRLAQISSSEKKVPAVVGRLLNMVTLIFLCC